MSARDEAVAEAWTPTWRSSVARWDTYTMETPLGAVIVRLKRTRQGPLWEGHLNRTRVARDVTSDGAKSQAEARIAILLASARPPITREPRT